MRKILNAVSPRLPNAIDGTTVLHSDLSYLSTLLASISCIPRFVCHRARHPPRRRLARVNSPGKNVGRGRAPCAGARLLMIGAQISIRTVHTSVRDFCVVLLHVNRRVAAGRVAVPDGGPPPVRKCARMLTVLLCRISCLLVQ